MQCIHTSLPFEHHANGMQLDLSQGELITTHLGTDVVILVQLRPGRVDLHPTRVLPNRYHYRFDRSDCAENAHSRPALSRIKSRTRRLADTRR
ncbi:hypothetical protein D3C76_923250 [compost metagenome]